MSEDQTFMETTAQSWGSRLGNSCKGIAFGFLFILGGLYLLGWNEGNSVAARRSLQEAEELCKGVDSLEPINSAYEHKLIYVSGMVSPASTILRDTEFQVVPPRPAIKLKRTVEMYQWTQSQTTQEHKKTGGKTETETSYTYRKEWVDHVVDASAFHFAHDHENPPSMPFTKLVLVAPEVKMGDFDVSYVVLDKISWYQALSPANYSTSFLPAETIGNFSVSVYPQEGYYFGERQTDPVLGDTRVSFSYIPEQVVSVIARQTGHSFSTYFTSNKRGILLVEQGAVSAEEMFIHANQQVTFMAWVFRLLGFLILWMGFKAIVQPISTFADVLPLVGNILDAGANVVTDPRTATRRAKPKYISRLRIPRHIQPKIKLCSKSNIIRRSTEAPLVENAGPDWQYYGYEAVKRVQQGWKLNHDSTDGSTEKKERRNIIIIS
eukprot:scaffold630_cov174-Amphora_coffeaeformis.AAC.2